MATVTHRVATALTTNVTSYASGAFTPAQNDLLVMLAAVSATVAAGSATASANGITFTKVGTAVRAGSGDTLYAFVSDQLVPSSPASMTVTMDVTGDAGTGCIIFVASVAGMTNTGLSAIRQFTNHDNYAIGIPNFTFNKAPLTANPQFAFMMNATVSGAAVTEPAGFTESADTSFITPDRGAEYAWVNSGKTAQTVSWGSSSTTATGALGIELDTSSGAAPAPGAGPYVVDATQAGTGDAAGTSATPALPTGWQPNDLLLLVAAATPSSNTFTKPGGWTEIQDSTSGNCRFYTAYKFAVSGESAPTVTISANNLQTGLICIRNVDTTNLFGSAEAAGGGTAASSATFPDVTPRNVDDFLIRIAATRVTTAGAIREFTTNPDGGVGGTVVRVLDVSTTQLAGGNTAVAVWVQNLTATTAPGADTGTITISTADYRAESISLKSTQRTFIGEIPI